MAGAISFSRMRQALSNAQEMDKQIQQQRAQAQTAQALQSRPYAIDERVFGVAREQTPTSLPNPFDSFRPSARFDLKPAVTPAEYYQPFYTVGFSPNARPAQTESEIQRLWDHAFPTMANVTLPGRQFGPVQMVTQDRRLIDGALARIRGQNARYDTALSNLTAQANQAAQNTAWGIVDPGAETAVANAQKVFDKIDADWYASRREALEMLGEQPAAQIRKLAEAEQGYKAGTAPEVYLALREQLENAYGAELLDSLLEYVRMEENAKRMENAREEAYQRGQKSGWFSLRNIGTVPQKLVGGVVGTAEALGQGLVNAVTGNNRPLDLNTPAQEATARADAFRSGAQEDMSGVGRFVYGTAMSLADSGVAILTGQPWILGTAAANSTMQEVKRNGGSESQALTMGVIAGVTEMLTEKLSIDSLFKLSDAKTVKDMLWNAVKQALPEAAEETVSSVVNLLADDVVMGEKSRYNQLIASGMTDKQAFLELAKEVGLNALGGGLSGFVMGSVKSAVDLAANPNTQAETAEQTEAPQTAEPAQAAQAVIPEQKPESQPVQTPKTTAQIMEEAAQGMVGKPDDLESRFVKFVSDRGGSVTANQMAAFAETLSEADMENLAVAVEEAANGGKLKWRSDGSIALPPSEADHIDRRDLGSVGSPKVKAFQYNNPEMHEYIREGAELFGADLANTTVGERFYLGNNPSEAGATPLWKGVKRHTTPYIAELKDNYGMSYAALDKAVEDLIADSGRENNAGAKRVELMIDRMLTEGYRAMDGTYYPPNEAYIAAKQKINGGSDTADGVGAKTSDFKHRVVNSQNHALGGVEARNAVPEDLRTQTTHDEITEAESLHNANLRLEQDYEGEKRYLENTVSWTGEDVDVGMKILEDLSREAHNTGDWTEYTRWRKVLDLHKEEIGRSLQALAKYARLTGDRIIENASRLLDDARDGTDVSEVMDTVATFSAAFDEAAAKKDVDQLVQIIRDTAQTRNMSGLVRSVFGKSGLPKEIDWAINRIAELAVDDLQKYEANPTADPVVRRFSVGDRVSPSDKNNVGTIVADHGDGTYSVHFVNPKTKAEATKKFSVEQLQSTDKTKKNSLSFPAEKHDVGKYYDFLKKFAANSIEAIAADKKKISGGKAAKTLRYNAMLSKASTVLRNLVNNGVLDGLDTLARDVSAVLDMAISRLTKTRSVAVDKGWFSEAKRKGALDGLAFALMECGLDVDTSGSYNKYENGAGRTFKMSGGPVERLLSSWEKLTAYNMSVTDEVSKGATEAEIQRGIDELRAKRKIKDDSLGGAGAQEARYRTLQDDTVLSEAVSDLRKTANRWNIAGFGLGDLALPFTKVPANVPMRVMDYSPAGLATGMFRMAQVLKSAKDGTLTAAEQARAVQSIGRGMTGTVVIAGLTALAAKGLIRTMDAGGKEENRDRAASLKSQGLSGTQWNLSATLRDAEGKESGWKDGDTILSVGFLEPFNAHMAIASLIAEDMKDGLTAGEIVTDTLSGTVQAVLELPVMQVLQDAANAYRYSDGETAGERFLDAGKSFLAGQATSWIPNSLKGIAQGLDPMQRDLYASDDPLKQVVDNFKGSIPKLREQTSAKLDVYGNPVENENRAMNFLNANVNPGSVGTYQTTPTTDVLNRVYEATGESSVYLSSSDLSEVKDVALDESQKRQFQTDRGDTYEAVVPAIGGDKNFWDLPNKMQVAILSVAEEYATQTAKEKLGVGYETESWVQELAGKSAEEIARECIKKGVERVGGLGKPIKFDASWAVVSGDVMDGAMKKAQAYADAVALEEMGYPMETDWMLKAKEAKTDKERQDLFMAAAVDAQAKKLGDGKKYVGLSEMLEDGDVDDKVALLVLPPDVVKRKTDRKIKVSATLLVDALAFSNSDAASSGKKDKNGKYLDGEGPQDKVLEYLRKDRRLPTSQVNKVMACLYEGWGR